MALNFPLLFAGKRLLGGLGFGGALLEFIHAPGGVHKLLLAGVKRMANVANANDDRGLGGTRLDHVAAGTTNLGVHIFRVNVRLHKKDGNISTNRADDKRDFLKPTNKPGGPKKKADFWQESVDIPLQNRNIESSG
jgi:hypothetical protein